MSERGDRPPAPRTAAGLDDLVGALVELRTWAGNPSFAVLATGIGRLRDAEGRPGGRPGKVTVYDCFRPGRRRIDGDLFADLLVVLGVPEHDRANWWRAFQQVSGQGAHVAEPGSVGLAAPRSVLVGRAAQFADLLARRPGSTSLVLGLPGAGKTELARHVAHAWRIQLGAGCVALEVDLRGYDPDQPPLSPSAVLARLLTGVGVPGARIDALDRSARLEVLRGEVGPEPCVILLDNAGSADQVAVLGELPPRWRVLVTSRRALPGAVDATDAAPVVLAELDERSAVDLLAAAVGSERTEAEPAAARRIAQRCGRLALDLTVAGALISASPDWSLEDHAARLEAMPRDGFLRPALQVSYAQLPPPVQATFRRLALHPGPRIDAQDVAALADLELAVALEHLALLTDEHLLTEVEPGRHRIHDVLRAFAQQHAVTTDPRSAQQAAVHRFADELVREVGIRTAPEAVDTVWFNDRFAVVVGLSAIAPAWHAGRQLGEIALRMNEYLDMTGQLSLAEELLRRAVDAGEPDQALALRRTLGRVLEMRGDLDGALAVFTEALSENAADNERDHNGIANVLKRMGRLRDCVGHYRRAAQLAQRRGNAMTHARAMGNMADALRLLAHPRISAALYARAEPIATGAGDTVNLAIMLINRSLLSEDLGSLEEAIDFTRSAIARLEELKFEFIAVSARTVLSRYLIQSGHLDEGEEVLVRTELDVERSGMPELAAELRLIRGRLLAARGDVAGAQEEYRAGAGAGAALGFPLPRIEAANLLGEIASDQGRFEESYELHRSALELAERVGDRREVVKARDALARLARD